MPVKPDAAAHSPESRDAQDARLTRDEGTVVVKSLSVSLEIMKSHSSLPMSAEFATKSLVRSDYNDTQLHRLGEANRAVWNGLQEIVRLFEIP